MKQTDPGNPTRTRTRVRAAAGCAALLLCILTASCRQSMANGPQYKTYQESSFFADGSSARPLPQGVIPLEREDNAHLATGLLNGHAAGTYPYPITLQVLQRGRERFNIYCSPCHDHLGTGQGLAVLRGFRQPPPSFHIDRLRNESPGYFFDVITNGFGAMSSYSAQIPPRDRWSIIAYVKTLQFSRNATISDVPPDARQTLEAVKQ